MSKNSTPRGEKSIWFYHNTISGGFHFSNISSWYKSTNPQNIFQNVRFINNLVSTRSFEGYYHTSVVTGVCDNNFLANATGSGGYCGSSKNIVTDSLVWNTTELHNFDTSGVEIEDKGIDISKKFTVRGKTYDPLPGFEPGYAGADGKPDIGAMSDVPIINRPICSLFIYNEWSECGSNNTKRRTVASSMPDDCIGGNPEIVKSCNKESVTDFIILKVKKAPTIDGNLKEYEGANSVSFSPVAGGNSANVKALWDSTALYLAFSVTDTELNASTRTHDGNVWSEDSVEWFIDRNLDGGNPDNLNAPYMLPDDYQGIVSILNTVYDSKGTSSGTPSATAKWDGSWQSEVVKDELNNQYSIEIKIPWKSIGYLSSPIDNSIVGMSFVVNDKDGPFFNNVMWPNLTQISAQNASSWQQVKLAGESVVGHEIDSPLIINVEYLD